MKMEDTRMKHVGVALSVLAGVLFPLLAFAQDDAKEPADLAKARDAYETAVAKALMPLAKDYAAKLEKMKKDYGKAGDLKAMLAIQKELDAVTPRLASDAKADKTKRTIVGSWRAPSGGFTWNFTADGKMSIDGWGKGTWVLQDDGRIKITRKGAHDAVEQGDIFIVNDRDTITRDEDNAVLKRAK